MKLSEAVRALEVGKKVKMVEWIENTYIELANDVLIDEDGEEWDLTSDSFLVEWEVYEEPVNMISFSDMVKGLRMGKKYGRSVWDSCSFIVKGNADSILYKCLRQNISCYWYPSVDSLDANDWMEVN